MYWNLDQVLYNNPNLQVTEFKNMTPTPFITCYTEDGETSESFAVSDC